MIMENFILILPEH